MQVNGAKIYFTIPALGGIPITQTAVSSFVVMVLLCTAGYFLGRNLQKRPGKMQVLTEAGVKMLYDMVADTMGPHNIRWTPYIGALMLSSLFGTLIGMTGIFRSTTSDVSTTLTWAVMTSVIVWYYNIRNNGIGSFLKNWLNPLNLVSDIAQPVSMAFRHFGNVAGGGVITSILYTALAAVSSLILNAIASVGWLCAIGLILIGVGLFIAWRKKLGVLILSIISVVLGVLGLLQSLGILSGVPIFQFGIPAVLSIYFDLFSGFVQALVFSLLSMVYIAGSCPDPAEAEAAE